MENKIKDEGRKLKQWQIDDAQRLFTIFRKRKDLAKVLGEKFTQETLAETAGFTSATMVWQYLHGHRPLNIKAARAFAKGLGVHVQDFSPQLATEIVSASSFAKPPIQSSSGSEDRSLSLDKLVLINAISDDEATLLEEYRKASDLSKKMILSTAHGARKRVTVTGVVDDQSNIGPLGAS